MNKLTTKINFLYFGTLAILILSLIVAWQIFFIPFVEQNERTKADLMLTPYVQLFEELIDQESFDELDIFMSSLLLLENEDNKQPLVLMITIELADGSQIKQANEERDSLFVNQAALFSSSTFGLLGSVEIRYNDFTYNQVIKNSNVAIVVSIVVFFLLFIMGQRILSRFIRPLSTLSDYLSDADKVDLDSFPNHGDKVSAEIVSVWDATHALLKKILSREYQIKIKHEIAQMAYREKVDAESANRSKSLFLANMSHEIRTPLTAIIGFADSLQNSHASEQKRTKAINTIIRNGKHLLEIINDILDLSKIESENLEIEHMEVSLLNFVSDIEEVFQPMIREKGLECGVNYHFPLPKNIVTDPTRLRQILFNLLGNAKKFTESGSIHLDVKFHDEKKEIEFIVKDSGIGLSQSQVEKIFTPFSQADASTTRKFGGTGLGLTISRSLAQMLGGDIQVKSKEGEGAEFSLIIAAGNSSVTNEMFTDFSQYDGQPLAIEPDTDFPSLVGNVLIAEDTGDIRDLISYYFDQTLVSYSFAHNGVEAYDMAMKHHFDLILMDMQMPILDGLAATKKLRADNYKGPIVALTANAMSEDRARYLSEGLNDFVGKPIDKKELYKVVAKYTPQNTSSNTMTPATANGNANLSGTTQNQVEHTPVAEESKNSGQSLISAADKAERKRKTKLRLEQRFKEQLPVWLEGMSSSIEERNKSEICRLSHVLKGLGGSFGYPEITSISSDIEETCKANDHEAVKKKFKQLEIFCIDNCGYVPVK